MKKSLRFFFVAALAMMSMSTMAQTTVTFDAATDKGTKTASDPGEDQITKDGVTIAVSNGCMNLTDQYRCYKGATFTVTSTAGNIAKVEISCTAEGTEKYGPGNFTDATAGTYAYEGKVGTWTGDAASFSMTSSTNQVRMNTVVVTLAGGSTEGGVVFSWEGAEAGATVKGGTVVATDGESVNYKNGDYWTIRINKKKADVESENVTVTFDEALQAGDVLAITGYRNKDTDANGTLYMLFENGAEIDEGEEVVWNNIHPDFAQQPNTRTYNINAEAGSKTIKIARSKASTNVFITKIELTRGGASGISDVKVVRVADGAIYNLAGQKVGKDYKGIVIMNGKKVVQK